MGAKSSTSRKSHQKKSDKELQAPTQDDAADQKSTSHEEQAPVNQDTTQEVAKNGHAVDEDDTNTDTVGEIVPTRRQKRSVTRVSTSSISSRQSKGSVDSRVSSKRMSFYDIVDANDINSYLVVGNQASAQDEEFLTRKKIMYVLNLSNLPLQYIRPDIQYKNVFLEDEEDSDLLNVLEVCLQALKEWKKKCLETKSRILVYSYNGLSRSCSVVLAHLMSEEQLTLKQAWTHLKEKHPSAKPNDGFLLQLIGYEQQHLHRNLSMTLANFYEK